MSKDTFYCWMRVLAPTSKVPKYVVDERGKEDVDFEPPSYDMSHSGRPPKRRSVESRSGKDTDAWFADELATGVTSDLVFDYGPVYRHRQMALSWLLTRQGKQWAAEADYRYVLMSFEREVL